MPMHEIIRWLIASIVLLLGLLTIIGNFASIVVWYTKGKTSSMIPLAGGLIAMFGLMMIPIEAVGRWLWIPLAIDPGCLYLMLSLVYALLLLPLGRGPFVSVRKSEQANDQRPT